MERPARAVYEPLAVDDGGSFTLLDIHVLFVLASRVVSTLPLIESAVRDAAGRVETSLASARSFGNSPRLASD
ncbi:MAG TPA: hypothetical protein VK137_02410, partial [Planctomycetaceae bacterium]|nr:hypothetical protein [Planctomycetaceae bacterium]